MPEENTTATYPTYPGTLSQRIHAAFQMADRHIESRLSLESRTLRDWENEARELEARLQLYDDLTVSMAKLSVPPSMTIASQEPKEGLSTRLLAVMKEVMFEAAQE